MSGALRLGVALVVGTLLISDTGQALAQVAPAETLLTNARVYTLDAHSSVAEAVLVRDTRIVATGTTAALRGQADPRAREIDLGGRAVIPGLIDSHIHAIRAGLRFTTEVHWTGVRSIPEAMARIHHAAATASPDTWIVVGGGWTPQQFAEDRPPTQSELIAAAPGRRVFVQLLYRAALLSPEGTHALRLSGDNDLPANAKFERDNEGKPNGWIVGDAGAITGLYAKLPAPAADAQRSGTKAFLRDLNRYGVTGVIDPGGHNLAPEDYETLFQLEQSVGLTVRVAYSMCAPRRGSELSDLQTMTRFLAMGQGTRMLRFNGIGERVTWDLYNNDAPSDVQLEDFARVARWAAVRGFALTVHWNNDVSVHHLLDVLEEVDRGRPLRDLRWSVAHLHDASETTLRRMQALGVGWLMQNGLHLAPTSYIFKKGSAISRAPPIKTALRLGLRVGAGTDGHRVMGTNPFVALRWLVDGRTVDGVSTRGAAELATREEALRLYTQGSAWFAFDEHNRGSLEPGRLADLAVLSADYMTVPLAEMAQIQSLLTMVDGRIVYAAGGFSVEERR